MSAWEYSTTPGNNTTAATGINWASTLAPSGVDNNVRQTMTDIAKILLDLGCSKTTGGTSAALTLTTNAIIPTLRDGLVVGFVAGVTCAVNATLNVDGEGAKAIFTADGAVQAGQIIAGGHYYATYDASANSVAGAWVLHNPKRIIQASEVTTSMLGTGAVTTVKLGDGAVTNTKLADMNRYTIKGRVASGTGRPQDLTPDELVEVLNEASPIVLTKYTMHRDGVRSTAAGVGNTNPGANASVGAALNPVGILSAYNASSGSALDIGRNSAGTIARGYVGSTQGGGIAVTTTTFGTFNSSDRRLKDEIAPLTGFSERIDAVQSRAYRWKSDGTIGRGFIADEIQAVYPGSVIGDVGGDDMQGVMFTLEQAADIYAELQALRQRVAALEGA